MSLNVRHARFAQWWEKSGVLGDSRSGEIRDSHSGGRTNVHRSLDVVGDSCADERPSELGCSGRSIGHLGMVGVVDGRPELLVKTMKKVSVGIYVLKLVDCKYNSLIVVN